MAGYSGTPLATKLGIVEGSRVLPLGAPSNYRELLAPLPADVRFVSKLTPDVDVVHVFTKQRSELAKMLTSQRTRMRPDAAIWVSWPKKASKIPTDITEDTIREVALPIGFVDAFLG